jgi:protocatechuate 4,5-dioxygenase alpha subunit
VTTDDTPTSGSRRTRHLRLRRADQPSRLPHEQAVHEPARRPARERFLADEAAYCDAFGLTRRQKQAVVERDWQAMLDLGGSIFYVYKLAMMDGKSMQYLGGVFTGMTEEEFVAALRAGGRTDV